MFLYKSWQAALLVGPPQGGVMARRWAQPHLKLIWFGSFFVLLFFHCITTDWQTNVKQRGVNILQWLYNSVKRVSIWLLCMTCCDRKIEHWRVSYHYLIKKKKSGTDLTVSVSCSGIQGYNLTSLAVKGKTLLNGIPLLICLCTFCHFHSANFFNEVT